MKRVFSAVLALLATTSLTQLCQAEDAVSPIYKSWASHKLGTSITLRETNGSGPSAVVSLIKQTLIQKTDDKVVLEVLVSRVDGGKTIDQPPTEYVYRKAFPLLPGVKLADIGKPSGRTESGEETIQAAGREFKATWYASKSQTEAGEATARTWMSDDVPGKLIRVESEVKAAKSSNKTELIEIKTP